YNGWNGSRASNHSIYAKWNVNQYTITFDSNGGSTVANITDDYMAVINKPVDPTKSGYVFDAWFYDADLLNEVTWPIDMPLDGLTLYAGWLEEQSEVVITFDANTGTGLEIDPIVGAPGTLVEIPLN